MEPAPLFSLIWRHEMPPLLFPSLTLPLKGEGWGEGTKLELRH